MRQVTAAIIVENGRVLLTRRLPGDPLVGLWEFPGGKIEPGETPQQCLERELQEELGMRTEVRVVLARTTYEYEHGSFELLAMDTRRLSDFELRVHDRYAWADLTRLANYDLAPADIALARLLWDNPL